MQRGREVEAAAAADREPAAVDSRPEEEEEEEEEEERLPLRPFGHRRRLGAADCVAVDLETARASIEADDDAQAVPGGGGGLLAVLTRYMVVKRSCILLYMTTVTLVMSFAAYFAPLFKQMLPDKVLAGLTAFFSDKSDEALTYVNNSLHHYDNALLQQLTEMNDSNYYEH
jgi:hypothetical protein